MASRRPFWRNKSRPRAEDHEEEGERRRVEPDRPRANQAPRGRQDQRGPRPRVRREDLPPGALAPSALSTTFSQEKNDPAIGRDFFVVDGIAGLIEEPVNRKFELDYSSFISLCRTSYDSQVSYDRGFAKYISPSMWDYYMIIQLWKRIMCARTAHGINVNEYTAFVGRVPDECAIPSDIASYLQGIGDIVDGEGRHNLLDLQATFTNLRVADAGGFYGKLSSRNHYMYETVPSPGVALLRIVADINFTRRGGPSLWSLPDTLEPAQQGDPTTSLLGWALAAQLTGDQLSTLDNVGISVNNNSEVVSFGVTNLSNIPINYGLIRRVTQILESSKSKCYEPISTALVGSMAQVPYVVRSSDDVELSDVVTIGEKGGALKSAAQHCGPVAVMASTFRYRLRRLLPDSSNIDCYCWDFRDDDGERIPVPDAWRANEDIVFEYGVGGLLWNTPQFGLSSLSGATALFRLSQRVRQKVART